MSDSDAPVYTVPTGGYRLPDDIAQKMFATFDWCKKAAPMSHDAVEKARLTVVQAKAHLAQAERDYLRSHGFVEEYDYDREIIRWREPKEKGGNLWARKEAMACAHRYAQMAKRDAERKIADLKKQHGIVDGGAN